MTLKSSVNAKDAVQIEAPNGTLSATVQAFERGFLSKADFISAMYRCHHRHLFDYASFLSRTVIERLEINSDTVIATVKGSGMRFVCPPGDHRTPPIEALNFGDYERSDHDMIMRLAPTEGCVLDVGANIGWYALHIAHARPACVVHAFEPVTMTYSYLVENISLNKLCNIEPHRFGASEASGIVPFYYYPEGSGNASASNLSARPDVQTITCELRRLDDIAAELRMSGIRMIKCDCEGAELLALRGAEEVIRRDAPIIFAELLRKWAAKFGYHPNEAIDWCRARGYKCYTAAEGRLRAFGEMTDETLETNFFFLHADLHADLIQRWTD